MCLPCSILCQRRGQKTSRLRLDVQAYKKFLQAVFDMAVMDGVAFERCHEVMKALADSWQNMKSIPARSGIEECFDEDRLEVRWTMGTLERCAYMCCCTWMCL